MTRLSQNGVFFSGGTGFFFLSFPGWARSRRKKRAPISRKGIDWGRDRGVGAVGCRRTARPPALAPADDPPPRFGSSFFTERKPF